MILRECSICWELNRVRQIKVLRFNLTRNGKGQGAIDLCQDCWKKYAATNRKPGRANRTKEKDLAREYARHDDVSALRRPQEVSEGS